MPKPVTRTEVALAVDQVSVAVPPAFMLVGVTLIAPATEAPGEIVTVTVRVIGPPTPCAVSV